MSKRDADATFEQCAKRLCVKVANMRLDERGHSHGNDSMALDSPYTDVNAQLRRLHHGNNVHRNASRGATCSDPFGPGMNEPSSSAPSRPHEPTQFGTCDVILCPHGENSRCLDCIGRKIHQISRAVHHDFDLIFFGAPKTVKCDFAESQRHGIPHRSLVSGEIYFPAFASLLGNIGIENKEFCFLDLGSGRGKAVVACALLFPHARACGVEIRPQLHNVAETLVMDDQVRSRIRFVQGNFFDIEWSDADVILVNGTGFDDELVRRTEKKLNAEAKMGAYIIAFSISLRVSRLKQLMAPQRYRMSWGNATVFTYVT